MNSSGQVQSISRLRTADTLLLIVDVQERLLPVIFEADRVVRQCTLLARAAAQLHIPIVVTEQYPERLGPTDPAVLEAAAGAPVLAKMLFSACTPAVQAAITALGRRSIIVCGIEAHVCALQTVLDLREAGYEVFVPYDAISSRTADNRLVGWERMRQAGAVTTSTESAIFELLREAGTPDFKALLPYLK